ncbi:MAG TPA: magnesium transporter CorA family protein [Kineosporiaceae bacterium]|nr:magnesium transporter CorA family protein [Kineosporiaceae bacterium]
MHVYLITDHGVEERPAETLPALAADRAGLVWVDVPGCGADDLAVLAATFGLVDVSVRACLTRNHVSKIHADDDHVFTVLHAPDIGAGGHVHYVELDQFLGPDYLVTVHGPLNPAVDPGVAELDTRAVLDRVRCGQLRPESAVELSAAIISSLTSREIDLVATLAEKSGRLEQRVMSGESMDDTEAFLTELFRVWYQLLTIRTMAVHSAATYDRMAHLARFLPEQDRLLVADVADHFETVARMADGQRDFLHGIIEFFQTRISTHMTIAADAMAKTSVRQNDDMRKITAWVAIVAVPTAVTGFFGQNVPYPGFGTTAGFVASAVIMGVIAVALYVVFKKHKWL